jgi:hypothetical protein
MKTETYTSTTLDGTAHELTIGPAIQSLFPSSSVFYDINGTATDLGTIVDPHAGTVGLDWKKGTSGWDNRGGARIINTVAEALNEGWIVTVHENASVFQGTFSGSVQVTITLPGEALLCHVDSIVDRLVASGDRRTPWHPRGEHHSDVALYTMTWLWSGDSLVYERSLGKGNGLHVDLDAKRIEQCPVMDKVRQEDVRVSLSAHGPQTRITAREQAAARRATTAAAVEGYDWGARDKLREALRTIREQDAPEAQEQAREYGLRAWEDEQMDRAADYRIQVRAYKFVIQAVAEALYAEGNEYDGDVVRLEDALANTLRIYDDPFQRARFLAAQYVAERLAIHGVRASVGFSVTL